MESTRKGAVDTEDVRNGPGRLGAKHWFQIHCRIPLGTYIIGLTAWPNITEEKMVSV